ncbi:tyrosine-type recombinase/integrase [Desulfovibrio litoralis]|uniref:Site-specific recombinase XerD n=1 Tax=Desulfovibrio litoralis DSM 11393 TaxID=1121455 RepID=A0A1M7TLF3_9BACT|nr:site-specific integrase [Desulfovibrio litoralis]SHN71562.1 Site-specific recombinase XerD [Desulfovibrio litoralis DSM 11393]
MATKYTRVSQNKWEGVYFYESTTKKHDSKPDMCYVVSFKVGDRKIWEKVGWKSQGISPQVAHQYRIKRIQEIHLGTPIVTASQRKLDMQKRNRTIGEIAGIYFESKGSDLKGLKTDKNRYEKHVDPLFSKSRVPDLTPIDIDTLKQSMGEKADGTIWNAIEILRRIINFGAKNNLCPALPFTIEMPKRDNERVEYLKEEEMQRLYAVMKNWPNQEVCRMLKLALFTAMRKGEIFNLEDSDLDFQFGLIRLKNPKGGKSVSIPMNQIARSILEEQQTYRDQKYLGCSFIFPGKYNTKRTECSAVDRVKEAAGLPKDFRMFHGLRHHYAVTLANSGKCTLDMIGDLLTHKSTVMTKRYGQFLPETMQKAGEMAAELLGIEGRHE